MKHVANVMDGGNLLGELYKMTPSRPSYEVKGCPCGGSWIVGAGHYSWPRDVAEAHARTLKSATGEKP